MKNLPALAFFVFFGAILSAQETNTSANNVPANAVRLDVFRTLFNNFHVSYERDITPNSSLVIGNGIYLQETAYEQLLGYGGDLQYRFTLRSRYNKSLHTTTRWYFAPKAWYTYIDKTEDLYLYDYNDQYNYLATNSIIRSGGIGGFMGMRIISSYHFDFDTYFGCGVQYSDNINSTASSMFRAGYTGVVYKAGLEFGVNF